MIIWSPGVTLEQIEKQVIQKAYQHFRQNKTVTSNALGIAIRTLDNKLALYDEQQKELEQRDYDDRKKREEWLIKSRGNPPNNLGIPYTQGTQAEKVSNSPTGIRMEPDLEVSEESSMSMQRRAKIQKLSR